MGRWKEIWGQICSNTQKIWIQGWVHVQRLVGKTKIHSVICSNLTCVHLKANQFTYSLLNWWLWHTNWRYKAGILLFLSRDDFFELSFILWMKCYLIFLLFFNSLVILWLICRPMMRLLQTNIWTIYYRLCGWYWAMEGYHSASCQQMLNSSNWTYCKSSCSEIAGFSLIQSETNKFYPEPISTSCGWLIWHKSVFHFNAKYFTYCRIQNLIYILSFVESMFWCYQNHR